MKSNILKLRSNQTEKRAGCIDFEKVRAEALQNAIKKQRAEQLTKSLAKLPPRYRNKTFADFKIDHPEQRQIKKIAERFVETFSNRLDEGACLIFLGKPGTGKTLLANIVYQALAHAGFSVNFESSLHFLRKFQDTNFDSHAAFERLVNLYASYHFLIIDEVTEGFTGKWGGLSDWEKQMLFTLIDARYTANRSTLIISNRCKEEMIERLGVRIVDRLSENGLSLAFTWQSYRQK